MGGGGGADGTKVRGYGQGGKRRRWGKEWMNSVGATRVTLKISACRWNAGRERVGEKALVRNARIGSSRDDKGFLKVIVVNGPA